jgi:hypothetical protein
VPPFSWGENGERKTKFYTKKIIIKIVVREWGAGEITSSFTFTYFAPLEGSPRLTKLVRLFSAYCHVKPCEFLISQSLPFLSSLNLTLIWNAVEDSIKFTLYQEH